MSNPSKNPDRAPFYGGPTMISGQMLKVGQSLVSPSGKYRATIQADGNFVVYDTSTGAAQWSTGTASPLELSPDVFLDLGGNIVVESLRKAAPAVQLPSIFGGFGATLSNALASLPPVASATWTSQTQNGDSVLFMQDDGNLVLYIQYEGKPFAAWSSKNGKAGHSTVLSQVASVAGIVFPVTVIPLLFATGQVDAAVSAIVTDAKIASQVVTGNIGGAVATATAGITGAVSSPPPPPVSADVAAGLAGAPSRATPVERWETFGEWWRRRGWRKAAPAAAPRA